MAYQSEEQGCYVEEQRGDLKISFIDEGDDKTTRRDQKVYRENKLMCVYTVHVCPLSMEWV